jgi:NarL family two-component system response regulator LiaR
MKELATPIRRPIRVVIVDDHDMVRSGLAVFMDAFDDLQLVGEARSGSEAIRLCSEVQPDVVLMDLVMPDVDGVAATHAIRQAQPHIQVIALTSFDDQHLVQGALRAGAIGYLLKNTPIDELASAIRAAHAGKSTLAPEALKALLEASARPPEPEYDLTERELEVLALVVEGLTNPEIGERLVIGQSTVKTHVSNILGKLGVSNRVEAASLAVERNLINRPRQASAG